MILLTKLSYIFGVIMWLGGTIERESGRDCDLTLSLTIESYKVD